MWGWYLTPPPVPQWEVCSCTWTPRRFKKGPFQKNQAPPPAFCLLSKTFILFSFSLCSLALHVFPLINFLCLLFFKLVALQRAIVHADFLGSQPNIRMYTRKSEEWGSLNKVARTSSGREVWGTSECQLVFVGWKCTCDCVCHKT